MVFGLWMMLHTAHAGLKVTVWHIKPKLISFALFPPSAEMTGVYCHIQKETEGF